MSASTLLRNPAGKPDTGAPEVKVEHRAATPEEVVEIDMTADEVVLPARLFVAHERWLEAIAQFPIGQPFAHRVGDVRSWRPPGSMVWAQLASRSRDMIVGGRDRFGLPSIPVPFRNGDIFFASVAPDRHHADLGGTPLVRLRRLSLEPDECQPILSSDGPIRCASSNCDDCLRLLTRDNWSTNIACVCSRHR